MESIKRRFLKISFILIVIGGIIFYIVSHPLVKEIISLARGAQEVEKGNLEFRASPGSLRETVQLSQSFNNMLDSLEKNRKELDIANKKMVRHKTLAEVGKFSLMVAHEFKNPLGIIKSSMDILRKDYKIQRDDVLAGYIEDEIRSLDLLIEDFLLFSKPAEPNFGDVDLNQLLKDICTRFEIMIPENVGRIVPQIPSDSFWAEADADLMTRSISNILKNALEADDNCGKVFVKAKPVSDNLWEASFEDQGPGIKPLDIYMIFEPFFTTKTKGTGLGLAFVSHVITAHGGSVTAVNKPDSSGAVFIIRIPLKQV
jgi:signal transduction histidine kinase